RIYKDFTGKVAEARGLTPEQIDSTARGRVWTGEDARAHGLIDSFGGYRAALGVAREAAGMSPDQPITVEVFPRPRRFWEMLDALIDTDFEDRLMAPGVGARSWIRWLFAELSVAGPMFEVKPLSVP